MTRNATPMPLSMYEAAHPVFRRHLVALGGLVDKAIAHAAAGETDPQTLFSARLAPDMWSFSEQVRAACGHAVRGLGRLAGADVPRYPGRDATLEDLKARLAWTIAFCDGLDPAAFVGAEDRAITFPLDDGERTMRGADFYLGFALPNFLFHAATAYGILRHNGVALHKRDFLGVGW